MEVLATVIYVQIRAILRSLQQGTTHHISKGNVPLKLYLQSLIVRVDMLCLSKS